MTVVCSRTSMFSVAVMVFDQVVGHAGAESATADEHRHPVGVLGQVDGGLAGGVAGADDVHLLSRHGRGLGDAAAVEHARADERLQPGDPEALVAGPGGQDDRAGGDLRAVGQHHDLVVAAGPQLGYRAQHRGFRAERPGLVEGPVAQLGTADAEGKAEVVADQ